MTVDASISVPNRKWVWLPVGMIAAGFLPLLYWHIAQLLERPHYQFIVFLPVVAWLLSRPRPDEVHGDEETSRFAVLNVVIPLVLAATGLAYATWIWSPWVAMVSALLAAFAMLAVAGAPTRNHWMPVWLFCWILVPPPFGLDEKLIVSLRDVTTTMSSSVLDQIGILHQRYANVIELPAKPLFIADACSGIHSLYVLMAVALFLAIHFRRSVFHGGLLLGSTFCLVLVENVTRIVAVAVGLDRGFDLSIGTSHTVLGVILFIVSVVLVLSMDQLLRFFISERPFAWLWRMIRRVRRGTSTVSRPKVATSNAQTGTPARAVLSLPVVTGIAAFFPVLAVGQLFQMPDTVPTMTGFLESGFDLPEFGADALPEDLQGFERQEYSTVERVLGDPFGQASQRWEYRKEQTTASLSLDYPHTALHDLCQCYVQVGWQIVDQRRVEPDQVSEEFEVNDVDGSIAIVHMHREFYGDKLLVFSLFDMSGNTDVILKSAVDDSTATRLSNRLTATAANPESGGNAVGLEPPLIVLQMLARSTQPLTTEETAQAIRFYLESRRVLKDRITTGR